MAEEAVAARENAQRAREAAEAAHADIRQRLNDERGRTTAAEHGGDSALQPAEAAERALAEL